MPRFPTSSPLPPFYYHVFAHLEPFVTLIGAVYALCFPSAYYADVLSFKHVVLLGEEGGGARGRIIVSGLGSCSRSSLHLYRAWRMKES